MGLRAARGAVRGACNQGEIHAICTTHAWSDAQVDAWARGCVGWLQFV